MSIPQFANSLPAPGPVGEDRLPESLEAEIRRIYARSPIYGERFPLHAEPLRWACYGEIPVLAKDEIMTRGHQAFFQDYSEIERGLQENRYEYESTSGTTRGPMTVIMEDGWWTAQTRRAYRASPLLREFADRPHRKCVLAPVGCSSNLCPYEDHPFPNRYFDGTVYLNLSSDPFAFPDGEWDRILKELQATQPDIIEGEPVYLSLLARAALRRGVRVPSVKVVILTYGKASRQHGQRIAEAFPAPQVDLYGSTEAGYLFVGEAFKDDSQVIDGNAFVELVPWNEERPDVFQILVTTREREAMPLLRYRTGDIVERRDTGYRILGREGSLIFRRDGTLVAPAEIDAALPDDFACWHYSLVQTGLARWDFHYVADHAGDHGRIEENLASTLGDGMRVNAFRRKFIAPSGSGKFILAKPLAQLQPVLVGA